MALYRGNVFRYKATAGQAVYEQNRQVCCRHYDLLKKTDFISLVEKKFFEDGWSLDACVGYALKEGLFTGDRVVCTKTLYGYTNLGLLGIKNIGLPEKLLRSPKREQNRETKRILGRSTEERPAEANDRSQFGHWEADLVIGSKKKDDDALLTMIERKTLIRVPGRDPNGVMAALEAVRSQYSEHWDDIFKTLTTDNGSEFSMLSGLEDLSKTLVYFARECEIISVNKDKILL